MTTSKIMLSVDSETAQKYESASADEQRKLQLLLRLRLRELTSQPKRTLSEIMDDIGTQAEARGLTPEIRESLLDER